MFVGQFNYTLDNKKRLVIPAKFRLSLSDKSTSEDYHLFATLKKVEYQNMVSQFLEIYPPEVWEDYLKHLKERSKERQEVAWYLRKIAADTELCKVDPQWRILVPTRLISAAELKRDIMIIGGGDHIEIWDLAKWNTVSPWLNNQIPQLEKYIYKP
jgi:MraZ protein